MLAGQGRHHRAAAIAGAHDGAAHRIPHIHEGERTRCVGADPFDNRPLRPQRREIIADAAALLHRQRGLAQMGEDPAHVVGDRPHHEAVEQGHLTPGAGAGDDPPGREKAEIAHRRVKPLGPALGVGFRRRDRLRDSPPGVLDRLVDRLARDRSVGRPPEPVFHVPDLLRDRGDGRHRRCFLSEHPFAAGQTHSFVIPAKAGSRGPGFPLSRERRGQPPAIGTDRNPAQNIVLLAVGS